jgi:hypothetical protein
VDRGGKTSGQPAETQIVASRRARAHKKNVHLVEKWRRIVDREGISVESSSQRSIGAQHTRRP